VTVLDGNDLVSRAGTSDRDRRDANTRRRALDPHLSSLLGISQCDLVFELVWIPPQWIDRQRRPILNPRNTVGHWDPQDPLDLD